MLALGKISLLQYKGTNMRNRPLLLNIFLLSPLVISFAFGLDLYIPVVPKMVHMFNTSQEKVQLTLSMFVFINGLGQVFAGPISDHFGRKKLVLFSLLLFSISSLFCAWSVTIEMLIISRVFEALGTCGMMVCSFSIIRDLYEGQESAIALSYLNGSIGVSPLFAPLIGGLLVTFFNWQAPFYALAIFSFFSFVTCLLFLEETHPAEKRIKIDRQLFSRYRVILSNKTFYSYVLCSAAGMSCFFTFFSVSPYLLIEHLGVRIDHFGYYFGTIGLIYFCVSFLSSPIIHRIGVYKTTLAGTILLITAGATMFLWNFFFGLSRGGLIVPMTFSAVGGAFVIGAGSGGALQPFAQMAGTASAVLGLMNFMGAFIVASIVMFFPQVSTVPLASTLLIAGICTFLNLLWRKNILNPKAS